MILRAFEVINYRALVAAFEFVRSRWHDCAKAGNPLVIQITTRAIKRSAAQNRRYWGMILPQIEQQVYSDGRRYMAEYWHEFFKRRFIGIMELPCGGVVGMSSSRLSTKQFSDFMLQVEAWAVNEGVVFDEDVINADLTEGTASA